MCYDPECTCQTCCSHGQDGLSESELTLQALADSMAVEYDAAMESEQAAVFAHLLDLWALGDNAEISRLETLLPW